MKKQKFFEILKFSPKKQQREIKLSQEYFQLNYQNATNPILNK